MTIPSISSLKIVELASVLAGPAVGQFFSELGAEVIKIENKTTGGDVTRRWKGPTEAPEAPDSAYYHSVNYGKEVYFLDLRQEADRACAEAWIAKADVVISNFKPASARRLEMDYERLSALNPRVIYAELYAFSPESTRPAFDVVLQAETGFLHLTGEPDGPPSKLPVALIDLLAAHQLKEAILIALLERERTNLGGRVSTSLYASALASLANQATNWLIAGQPPRRMGSRHPNIAPYGDMFQTADDYQIVLAIGTEAQFGALLALLQIPAQERFATNAGRVRHREALIEWLQPAIARWKRDELLKNATDQGIPVGAIRPVEEVLEAPANQPLLLEQEVKGRTIRSVRTAVFNYEPMEDSSSVT